MADFWMERTNDLERRMATVTFLWLRDRWSCDLVDECFCYVNYRFDNWTVLLHLMSNDQIREMIIFCRENPGCGESLPTFQKELHGRGGSERS